MTSDANHWLVFIQAILPQIAWPIVVLTGFLLTRRELLALLRAVTHKIGAIQSVTLKQADMSFTVADLNPPRVDIHDLPKKR